MNVAKANNYTSKPFNTGIQLPNTLICFSHLRWDFVYQRPQHILSRLAAYTNILFIEEPVFTDTTPQYHRSQKSENVTVFTPHLPHELSESEQIALQKTLLDELLITEQADDYTCWYYTPMALQFTSHLNPVLTVYDCMDELAAFKFAPQQLKDLERTLFDRADVVFTGGNSLYEAKKDRHSNVHAFPSSIDKAHFGSARHITDDPNDQEHIPYPRIGFFGVIDERFDIELIREVAGHKPEWQFIVIGPVVKIDPNTLPQGSNIHYLGSKSYSELPAYLSGWQIATIPFALNESTKFISPTKTPEYLAAGIPVISAPINDVVHPYADEGLVQIANDAETFIKEAEQLLTIQDDSTWLAQVDAFLEFNSWDDTVAKMIDLMKAAIPTHN